MLNHKKMSTSEVSYNYSQLSLRTHLWCIVYSVYHISDLLILFHISDHLVTSSLILMNSINLGSHKPEI